MVRLSRRAVMLAAVFIVLALLLPVSQVSAKTVQAHKKGSHTVIVGDSRVVGLWNSKYRLYSLIGSSGGQYTTNDNRTIHSRHYGKNQTDKVPSRKSRYSIIRNSIRAALKKHHRCRVVLFATINECRTDRVNAPEVDKEDYFQDAAWGVVDLADDCRISMKVRTTKKEQKEAAKKGEVLPATMTVRSEVYIIQCPTASDFGYGVSYPEKYIKKYNREIQKYLKGEKHMTFVPLKREPKKSEFGEDGLHFRRGKTGYNAYLWKLIKSQKFAAAEKQQEQE